MSPLAPPAQGLLEQACSAVEHCVCKGTAEEMAWLMPLKPAANASRDKALRTGSHLYSQYLNVRSLAFSSDSHCASTFCQACNIRAVVLPASIASSIAECIQEAIKQAVDTSRSLPCGTRLGSTERFSPPVPAPSSSP